MLIFALACVTAPEDTASPPTAWVWSPDTAPAAPLLDAAGVGSAIDELVGEIVETQPRTVHDAFSDAASHVDPDCPEREQAGAQLFVAGDCTTEDGWSWYGVGAVTRITDMDIVLGDIDAYHRIWDFSTGNVIVVSPEGARVSPQGSSWYRDYDDADGSRALTVAIWGEFASDLDPWGSTWLGTDRSVELYVDLRQTSDGNAGTWSGGMSRLPGGAWAFILDDLVFDTTCPEEPGGGIRIQDQAGTWYTITYDTTCDGCGAVSVDGAALGTACADLTPLSTWEDNPWSG